MICRQVDGLRDCITERGQKEKNKYSIAYTRNLENDTDELICKAEIVRGVVNKFMITVKEGEMNWGDWD